MYNMTVENIKAALGNLDGIKSDLQVKKAVEFLLKTVFRLKNKTNLVLPVLTSSKILTSNL